MLWRWVKWWKPLSISLSMKYKMCVVTKKGSFSRRFPTLLRFYLLFIQPAKVPWGGHGFTFRPVPFCSSELTGLFPHSQCFVLGKFRYIVTCGSFLRHSGSQLSVNHGRSNSSNSWSLKVCLTVMRVHQHNPCWRPFVKNCRWVNLNII